MHSDEMARPPFRWRCRKCDSNEPRHCKLIRIMTRTQCLAPLSQEDVEGLSRGLLPPTIYLIKAKAIAIRFLLRMGYLPTAHRTRKDIVGQDK